MIITATCKQKATQMWIYCDNRILNLNCSRAWWKSNTNEITGNRQTSKTLRWVNDIHHQWWNTGTIPSEMQDIYWEKYRHRPGWNQVGMNTFQRAKEQHSYVFNLLRPYTIYWMQKVTLRMGTFADGIMMFCRINFVNRHICSTSFVVGRKITESNYKTRNSSQC